MALTELIDIYGRLDAAEVERDPEYLALCRAMDEDRLFDRERARVEKIKRDLEGVVVGQVSRQKQVKYTLLQLQQLSGEGDQECEICLRLARKAYFPGWTDKQKIHFEAAVEKLLRKEDYFLSFTQRYLGEKTNPINRSQYHLIYSFGLDDPKDRPTNELAHALDIILRRAEFRGFFFKNEEKDSRPVGPKLQEALDRTNVFVQLVQNDMFSRRYPSDKNYCFDEYDEAVRQGKEVILLFADGKHPDDLIARHNTYDRFGQWHGYIRGTTCVDLVPTQFAEQSANVEENQKRLRIGLVEKMKKLRESLWNNVPDDLD